MKNILPTLGSYFHENQIGSTITASNLDCGALSQHPRSDDQSNQQFSRSYDMSWSIDDNAEAPDKGAVDCSLKKTIGVALDTLSLKERKVLEMRFGINPDIISSSSQEICEMTLQQVGDQYGVTRERIRQVEARALRKLRQPTRISDLEDFKFPDLEDTGFHFD